MTRRKLAAPVALALAMLSAGCGDGQTVPRAPGRVTTTVPPPPTTVPPPSTLPRATSVACPTVPAQAAPAADRPRYALDVDVRPAEEVVEGRQTVRFVPDRATDHLVFRLWPNAPRSVARGGSLETGAVLLDGRAVSGTRTDPTTLVVRPALPLRAGQEVKVEMPWRLTLPSASDDRVSLDGEAVRLGSFFPILAWEPGVGWATEPPVDAFAEASTAPVADFDLTVTAPEGLGVLASGVSDRPGHWRATAMRDVAVSVGRFRTASAVARAPSPVDVTVGVHDTLPEDPALYLRRVVGALEDFARRFGPYPWRAFSLSVTPQLGGGIEYPGHVLQGPGTFGRTTSHEVGHQWFYGLVGNDQGRDPWMDEGLATWAEIRHDGTVEELRLRPVPAVGRGRVGEPMTFWESQQGAYYRSVYVQGAQALAALGPPDLVDCALRVYAATNAHRIARPADLVAAAAAVFPDAAATLAGFGIRP